MKTKTIIVSIILSILLLNVSVQAKSFYQESSNVTSFGIWTDFNLSFDGNWSSYAVSPTYAPVCGEAYITYQKPKIVSNKSVWQVKDSAGTTNLTIPLSCYKYFKTYVYLRVATCDAGAFGSSVGWYCYEGQNLEWNPLREVSGNKVYEEAMIWAI